MSKVFADLKPHNKAERNGFDLSRRSVFSLKCGQIVPVFCQATLPDSEYQIDVKQLLRTQPLQTAAFTGFSVNYDFFFVPNNYSYSSFNEFISQRPDARHVGQPNHNTVPRFNYKEFIPNLICCAVYDYMVATHFTRCAGYQHVGPVSISENILAPFVIGCPNFPEVSVSLECVRSLDMFGYGNYLPYIKLMASSVWRDLLVEESITTFDDFVTALELNYARITSTPITLDSANNIVKAVYRSIIDTEQSNIFAQLLANAPAIEPTLWPFMAYNKGFYEFYRSVYYDDKFTLQCNSSAWSTVSSYNFDYVQLFNADDFSSMWLLSNYLPNDNDHIFLRMLALMVPKYHLYKKDLFTGVLPSTQFGDVSLMFGQDDWSNLYATLGGTVTNSNPRNLVFSLESGQTSSVVKSRLGTSTDPIGTQFKFDPSFAISVLESRRADAMQRFKERMLRAGNKVKDVFKAHGWSEPYSSSESSPVFLGTFDGRLDINTVAATTSNGEGQELAQLGANGTAVVNGSKIRFKCHDFGVIIGVMYIVKDAEVDAYGVERQHCLTDPFDYPYPELQNISLAPIDTLELSSYLRFTNNNSYVNGNIIGYLPRFMEYKTAVDKVHGEFYSAAIFPDETGHSPETLSGVFSDWVTPRLDINVPQSVSFLYQSPSIADNVFLVASNALQDTDQFLVNCLFDVKAVEPVSVIGLPI